MLVGGIDASGDALNQGVNPGFSGAILVGGADEVAAEVIYVALLVHQVLLILALDLYAFEALGGEVLRVVNVNHVLIVLLAAVRDNDGGAIVLRRPLYDRI